MEALVPLRRTNVGRSMSLLTALPRRKAAVARALRKTPLRLRSVFLTNSSGYRIRVHIVEPDDHTPRPGVLLVPGRDRSSAVFRHPLYLLNADELAVRGLRVHTFDPVGRGESWGHDDFFGSEGQDSFRTTLEYIHNRRRVQRDAVGVVTFSLGLALAARQLALHGERLGTRVLVDWEAPNDRAAVLRGGDIPPSARAALDRDPERFWDCREPMNWIGQIPCAYVRIQSRPGHRQGNDVDAALQLTREAVRGASALCQLNDNPPCVSWRDDQVPALHWAPSDGAALNRYLLTRIARLLTEPLAR